MVGALDKCLQRTALGYKRCRRRSPSSSSRGCCNTSHNEKSQDELSLDFGKTRKR